MPKINCTVTKSSWYLMYIEYSVEQNQDKCTSKISHSLRLKQLTDTYDFNGNMNVTYYINGNGYTYNGNVNIDNKGNTGYTITIKSGTTTIQHNTTTGAGSFTVSCSGSCYSGGWGPGAISLSKETITLTTIPRGGTWTAMPHRWYINEQAGGIRTTNPSGSNYVQVKFDKNAAVVNDIWIKYNGKWSLPFSMDNAAKLKTITSPYTLPNSDNAIYSALDGLSQNGVFWYSGGKAYSKYYDTQILLRSYNSANSNKKTVGKDDYSDIRVEVTLPYLPSNFNVSALVVDGNKEDYSYPSNTFILSWNAADFCSHYVIKYEVYRQNDYNSILQTKEIEVAGHSTTQKEITIDGLLAGQFVRFYIKGRWKRTVTNSLKQTKTFVFDTQAWSNYIKIQKQGGMIARVGSEYKNCHIYITDNNGQIYKADAAYVCMPKENSNETEYRLVKMK